MKPLPYVQPQKGKTGNNCCSKHLCVHQKIGRLASHRSVELPGQVNKFKIHEKGYLEKSQVQLKAGNSFVLNGLRAVLLGLAAAYTAGTAARVAPLAHQGLHPVPPVPEQPRPCLVLRQLQGHLVGCQHSTQTLRSSFHPFPVVGTETIISLSSEDQWLHAMGYIIAIIFSIMIQQDLLLLHLACSFAFYTIFQLEISLLTIKILTGHRGLHLVPPVPEQP